MRTTHAAVAQLRGRLWEETAAEPESDLRRELESMGPGRAASLETLMAERRAVLLSSRAGEEAAATRDEEELLAASPPSRLCEHLSELWGTAQASPYISRHLPISPDISELWGTAQESAAQRQLLWLGLTQP